MAKRRAKNLYRKPKFLEEGIYKHKVICIHIKEKQYSWRRTVKEKCVCIPRTEGTSALLPVNADSKTLKELQGVFRQMKTEELRHRCSHSMDGVANEESLRGNL